MKGLGERFMFGLFGKKKEEGKVVYTKDELKKAIANKESQIIVGGELAQKLKWISKISPAKIALLITFLATATIPNPTSGAAALAATGIVGKDVALIIFTSGVSITLILSVLKGYNVEIEGDKVSLKAK